MVMRVLAHLTVLTTLGVGLAGCGFSPLYAQSGDTVPASEDGLQQVSVALIPDRNGQELRQDLQQRLAGSSGEAFSRYDLYVSLAITPGIVAIDQQSAGTRNRQSASASWTLKANDAMHTTLASGAAHSLDGFDYINQQFFAADLSQESAVRRIDEALADQIRQQLAIWFKQHPPAS